MFRLIENARSQGSTENNLLIIVLVVALLAGGAGFFGGMKYQQSKTPSFSRNFQGQRGQGAQVNGNNANQGLRPVSGTIISQDENSITVKLADESSKIILLADSSTINKTEEGSKEDLTEGTEVTVFGQANSDGSITAQNIQIGTGLFRRPEGMITPGVD
jgi:hypothetical protein